MRTTETHLREKVDMHDEKYTYGVVGQGSSKQSKEDSGIYWISEERKCVYL